MATKIVLLALAERADRHTYSCYPAIPTIAADCGMSPRAVQNGISKLRSLGLITVTARGSGKDRSSNVYTLCAADAAHDVHPPMTHHVHHNDAPPAPGGAPRAPGGGAPRAHKLFSTEPNSEPITEPAGANDKIRREGFEVFWKCYPRKIGRRAAEKAWNDATKIATAADILAGLGRHKWPDNSQYIPGPAKWLADGRWSDEPDAPLVQPAPPPKPPPGQFSRSLGRNMTLQEMADLGL